MFHHRPDAARARRPLRPLLIVGAFAASSLVALFAVDAGAGASGPRTLHVAPWGDDTAAGSEVEPFRTVDHAVRRAASGDSVELRGGVYHETVQIYDKEVHIRSRPGERAVFDGAIEITGFVPKGGDWYHKGWVTEFDVNTGPMVSPDRPGAGHPDQVFLDGVPLRQVFARKEVVPGTFFHASKRNRIWLGDDPTGRQVEASALSWALYFNRADGSSLTDVTVRRYATEGAHMAAIRAYGDDLEISGVTAELNAYTGLSVMGDRISVSDSRFTDNGYIGLHGHELDTLVVDRVAILGNNRSGFDALHSAAGLKVTNSRGITIRDSDASRNDGPGLWTDLWTDSVTISRNLLEHNGRSGIELELSSRINVVGNVAVGNGEAGIWVLESQDVAVFHNAVSANVRDIWVEEGPRAEVQNVWLRNNVLGEGRSGSPALLNVDDWTEERSAGRMNVTSDYNAFWLPPSSPTANLSRWANWPEPLTYGSSLDEHRAVTGQDAYSIASGAASNPFVRDVAAGDYRTPEGTRLGAPVRNAMAAEIGVPSGTRLPIGPVAPVVRR